MYSVIFHADLEISLGMGADRAGLRCGGVHHDMAAVPALPNLDLALLEDLLGLHVPEQGAAALLVMLLDLGRHAEFGGQLRETLLLGGLGKQGGDLLKALFLRLGSKVGVLVPGLRLPF